MLITIGNLKSRCIFSQSNVVAKFPVLMDGERLRLGDGQVQKDLRDSLVLCSKLLQDVGSLLCYTVVLVVVVNSGTE